MFTRLETKITIIENFNDYTKYFTDQCILIIVVRKNVQNNVQKKKKIWNVISKSEIPSPKYRRTLKNLDTTRRTIFLSFFLRSFYYLICPILLKRYASYEACITSILTSLSSPYNIHNKICFEGVITVKVWYVVFFFYENKKSRNLLNKET